MNHKYREADKYIDFNIDDQDLEPIRIWLPEPPRPKYIANYGKPSEEQKFEKEEIPEELRKLEEQAFIAVNKEAENNKAKRVTGQSILEKCWQLLEENKSLYSDEIRWIKKQLYFIENGYWVYINGKPTYIDGWHYEYLNFFNLDTGLPDYRDKDRRWYIFAKYCYITTYDDKGNDLGRRTCYGFNYPKMRRDGATYRSIQIMLNLARNSTESNLGIQSFDDNNAGEHYDGKLIPAWQKYPFFLRPMWSGSFAPATQLKFSAPDNRHIPNALNSKIVYATTADRKFFDGWKLKYYLGDEEGKTTREDVRARWNTVKETLSLGSGINVFGFSIHPTTVADMKEKGGENYYDLCEDSKFYERNPLSGQTVSGLLRLFFPAWDGLEGFIGPYGESVIETPTAEQAKYIGKKYGAKEYILSKRQEFLDDGSPEAMKNYYEFIELYPIKYEECFRVSDGHIGFNVEYLDRRIAELNRGKSTVRGNFKRVINGIALSSKEIEAKILAQGRNANIAGHVIFDENPEGRWELSEVLKPDRIGLKVKDEKRHWKPKYPHRYTTSADTFRFNKKSEVQMRKDKDKMSDGGIGTFKERDYEIDPEDKPIQQWDSYRFVCTYRYRPPSDDEFAEDVLMQCEYFGSMLYPEMNIESVWKWFEKRGYGGFLLYGMKDGKKRQKPGFSSLEYSKQEIFNLIRNYIENRCDAERHKDFLMECKKINGIEQMTKFDLFTACGGALLGSANRREPVKEMNVKPKDILQMFGVLRPV